MAQAISLNMRRPFGGASSSPTYLDATCADTSTQFRLKQNFLPKVILQCMLGQMFLCGAAAYWLTNMRRVLPHNPCSIAGVATLLAGSRMCTRERVPKGSEWLSAKQSMEARLWEGDVFSLGWWVDGDRGRRFGVDVERAEATGVGEGVG
jgi:hypothetical protein